MNPRKHKRNESLATGGVQPLQGDPRPAKQLKKSPRDSSLNIDDDDSHSSSTTRKTIASLCNSIGKATQSNSPHGATDTPAGSANLIDLLDLSDLDTIHDLDLRFSHIAHELIHNHLIEIRTPSKTEHLQILELEFYLYKSGCHEDPFTHASEEQAYCGQWYFHRPPSRSHEPGAPSRGATGYRGGTRKGLDLTIGNPPAPTAITSKYFASPPSPSKPRPASVTAPPNAVLRGGILLRSARRTRDAHVISGPSLLVDEVLRASGAPDIPALVGTHWRGEIGAFASSPASVPEGRTSTMCIVRAPGEGQSTNKAKAKNAPSSSAALPEIYRSPRIGLDLSHPSIPTNGAHASTPNTSAAAAAGEQWHPRVRFIARAYRFFAHPHLLTANGRPQTFVGVHDALCAHQPGGQHKDLLRSDGGGLLDALVRHTGLGRPTAERYLDALKAGEKEGAEGGGAKVAQFLGKKGKTATSAPVGWLKMVGVLRTVGAATAPASAATDESDEDSGAPLRKV